MLNNFLKNVQMFIFGIAWINRSPEEYEIYINLTFWEDPPKYFGL